MRCLSIVLLSAVLIALSGCGNKGELYLPASDTPAPTAAEPSRDDSVSDPVNVERPPL